MKKLLNNKIFYIVLLAVVVVAAVLVIVLSGNRTYMADGTYLAFSTQDNDGKPQVTWVTVTIADDEIVDYNIDCIQGSFSTTDGKSEWKPATKKELAYEYAMHAYDQDVKFNFNEELTTSRIEQYRSYLADNDKLEWFEQARIIEKQMLEKGLDSFTLAEDDGKEAGNLYYQGISGVSIADNEYVALAKQAVENAKNGVVIKLEFGSDSGKVQVDFVTATIDADRKVQSVKLDCYQTSPEKLGEANFKFAWDKSKQEKGYGYHMFAYSGGGEAISQGDEAYAQWCEENEKLEWFQQVELICNEWMKKGSIETCATKDGKNEFVNISSVSIQDNNFKNLFRQLETWGVQR